MGPFPNSNCDIFINGQKLEPATQFTMTDIFNTSDIKPWSIDLTGLKPIALMLKPVWKNKIQTALGFTHYVKNNRLYRKSI